MLDFGRDICGDCSQAEGREWLVTNGIGGYASGTIGGMLTRRYHGLLIAATNPPAERTLLLTKLDETARYQGQDYKLFANRWDADTVEPEGYKLLERFTYEGTTPVWTYALGDALLEKRVWMRQWYNTTYIQYRVIRSSGLIDLSLKAVINRRDHHGSTTPHDKLKIESAKHGFRVMYEDSPVLYMLSQDAKVERQNEWYKDYYLSAEQYRGFTEGDANLYAGLFTGTLKEGDSLTIVASAKPAPPLDGASAYIEQRMHEQSLISGVPLSEDRDPIINRAMKHLLLAADQFIVRRATPGDSNGRSVIAGYHWFTDWGRDTMIALPGLTIATKRFDVAASILHTFDHFVDKGMLPNRFPDAGETPEYNTVDATLWYFEAIRAYHAATNDISLVQSLYYNLQDIIDWYVKGTCYNIKVDPEDGLVYAGEEGVQLTWMDAKVKDWVVTPRIGKPVEISALWYNALRIMVEFSRLLNEPAERYESLAEKTKEGFARFWNTEKNACYDVLDSPKGDSKVNDAASRPNQIFAVSLHYSPLDEAQQKAIVDVCAKHLLTSHGLRSLAPDEADYVGTYGGDIKTRDGAYHQGTVWGWLIGPFASAHLKVYSDKKAARALLMPLLRHLDAHGVGSLSEIFDGDAPFTPRGAIAQAWSVAEVLRVWQLTS